MAEDTSKPTKDPTKFVEQVKLFEVDSGIELRPHPERTQSLVAMCAVTVRVRCVPLTVRMSAATGRSFDVLEVHAGVESLLVLESEREQFAHDGELPPTVLQIGQSFSMRVCNKSDGPARFFAEVWGIELKAFPIWEWEYWCVNPLPTNPPRFDEEGRQVLGSLVCARCGHKLRLMTGGRIPLWCPSCVEVDAYASRVFR